MPRITIVVVLGAILLAAGPTWTSAQARYCRPADTYGPALVADLSRLVTTTDARIRAARDSFYHVPVVDTSEIALVTRETTCRRALQALVAFEDSRPALGAARTRPASASSGGTAARRVVVVRHGKFWAVEDPASVPEGRFMTVVLFNAKWRPIGGYSGP